ncbi:MAG TPA: iron-containing alcohol dehydrogenase [Spirochaetota bacterium]|nr:iron-containing alcohol dehydrogenase [Spirochaetota bacterium]
MFLPDYYEFCARVKTVAGHRALDRIPELLSSLGSSRPMIVTDRGVVGAGLIKLVNAAMKGSKAKIGALYDETPPDSEYTVVNSVAKLYRAKKCDSILAVGGGSVMDTAKGVNILASLGGSNIQDYEGAGAVRRKLKPLIAIPTTSGTGSEVTLVAVIADHKRKVKIPFTSYFLLPDIALLDSRMTKTLPPFLTAPTAMDALTHACEAYYCLAKNPLSDATAIAAIRLISANLLKVIKKPGDLQGRLDLANGAILAGMAFSNSMVGIVHNLGHATGGVCGVPHGVCMSLFLPYGLEYNLHKRAGAIGELLFPLAGPEVYAATPVKQRPEKTIEYIRGMNQDLHDATGGRHARFLKEIVDRDGRQLVPVEKLPEIARTAQGDGTKVYNPEDVSYDDALMVLEHAYEGKPLDRKRIKKG